ncbi:MAG TPA: Asd/ArgC dimerization domain-containing protein [Candidatus Dormibacteraeota bacterium]|nr:Asd/ArgC dimerization domain-containing protein [Candidatus Dormibacteraeota bacterium]
MAVKSANSYRVAIVGASSLLGKELKLVLEDRHFPAIDIVLLDSSVVAGTLTEAGGEPTFIRSIEEDSFEGLRFVFFAGNRADTEQNWQAAQSAGATVMDLTGCASVAPAVASIPSLVSVLHPQPISEAAPGKNVAFASPFAPVIIACTLAAGLAKFQPQRTMAMLFPPVSDRDQAGIEELETQSASLLSFREIGRTVFDAQVAFNLLAHYGVASKPKLTDIRAAIARDVAAYIAGRVPVPAIQLLQAPVFYGYAFAAYADVEPNPAPDLPAAIEASLASLGCTIATADDPSPDNVTVAGESEIQFARVSTDPNIPGGVWLWGVADHLRLAATNAVRIAEELIATPQ